MRSHSIDPYGTFANTRADRRERNKRRFYALLFCAAVGWLIWYGAHEENPILAQQVAKCVWVQELNRGVCE